MHSEYRVPALALGLLSFLAFQPQVSSAGTVTFNASGTPTGSTYSVDVAVTFKNVSGNLEIDLYNNAAATDPLQLLSGLLWNVSGSAPSGTSLSSGVTGSGSDLYTSGSTGTPNAELRSSVLGSKKGWQYLAPPGPLDSTSFQFGLGASGLSGAFGGLGNADYGLAGPLSNIGHVPVSNQLPLVMSTSTSPTLAVFVVSGFNVDVSNIKDVTFAFGSAGDNNIAGHVDPVPEPATLVLAATGFLVTGLVVRRRHRR